MATSDVEARFATLAEALKSDPRVKVGGKGKGFGSAALRTGKRIFAVVSSRGEFVVKLPASRVEALASQGAGHRFDPGMGRLMKEWLAVDPFAAVDWLRLAQEALEFVSASA